MRTYRIDFRAQEPYEAGTLLLVLLVFPRETKDDHVWARLHQSLCAEALRARAASEPQWANAHQAVKPIHFVRTPDEARKDLRTFDRRLRDRMVAGRIANAILFDVAGLDPKLPKGCDGFSIKQLIGMALDDLGQQDAENAEQRIWREPMASVHIAAAVQAYLNRPDKAPYEVSYGDIIFDPEAIRWIVARTVNTQELMRAHPDRFTIKPAEQIQLQLFP